MERKELVVIAVVVLFVFAGVFFYLINTSKAKETWIEGQLLVKSATPLEDIQNRLSDEKILVQENLFTMNDSRNSAVAIMAAETARALAFQGKNVSVYAIVEGGENVCGDTPCAGAQVIVRTGGCDCILFIESEIVVEGSEKFLIEQSIRFGRLVGFALSKVKNQS